MSFVAHRGLRRLTLGRQGLCRMSTSAVEPSPTGPEESSTSLAPSATTAPSTTESALAEVVETAPAPRWRVATYNVLSPNLCSAGYFTFSKPEACEPAKRLARVQNKLDEEIGRNGIICLQEVSHSWLGELHTFFAKNKYTYIHDSYGYHFNGYMGVGVAFNHEKYALEDCKVVRIADTKGGGYALRNNKPRLSPLQMIFHRATGIIKNAFNALMALIWKPKPDLWWEVERRTNTAVFLRLQDRESGQKMCVSTYHMPCAFRTPPVISAHCSLLVKRINKLAQMDPYVIAGDFNLKPDSPMYELLTTGKFQSEESKAEGDMPEPAFPGDRWAVASKFMPLKSAYAVTRGNEPEFTNLARTKSQPQGSFIECLDYIFYQGPGIVAEATDELPSRESVADIVSFPTVDEPSDHIKIAAEFTLGNKRRKNSESSS
mmetsp:Transcript_2520/g.5822  ORF Transcript_2520/g.5822 Transcript_2520/m.5822 type:complete len:432 (+) Transcript_2520:42-1337(+)